MSLFHYPLRYLAEGSQLDNAEILTTQCEAYEVMKRQDKPIGAEQTYEEVELTTTGRGPQARATPTERADQLHNVYEEPEVTHGDV